MIIELTQTHGGQHNPIWLNANDISFMEMGYKSDETFTIIYIQRNGGSIGVMETPEEIIELIKQAK
jgi:hypothetical protein